MVDSITENTSGSDPKPLNPTSTALLVPADNNSSCRPMAACSVARFSVRSKFRQEDPGLFGSSSSTAPFPSINELMSQTAVQAPCLTSVWTAVPNSSTCPHTRVLIVPSSMSTNPSPLRSHDSVMIASYKSSVNAICPDPVEAELGHRCTGLAHGSSCVPDVHGIPSDRIIWHSETIKRRRKVRMSASLTSVSGRATFCNVKPANSW